MEKIITKKQAEKLFNLYSRKQNEESRSRGYNHNKASSAKDELYEFEKELGLKGLQGEKIKHFVWINELYNRQIPDRMKLTEIENWYNEIHGEVI